MKSIHIFLFSAMLLFLLNLNTYSQINDTIITASETIPEQKTYELPEIFQTDNNLKLIGQFIPQNWVVFVINDTMRFLNLSPVYKLSQQEIEDTTKKGRTKFKNIIDSEPDTIAIEFLLQPLWSGVKVDDAKFKNSHTQGLIDKLPARFKISHIIDSVLSADFDINSGKYTENEKKSILRYFEEKEKLEREIIVTPDFHTTSYSLFLNRVYPDEKDRIYYTPPGMISEMDMIIGLFEKFAGK